MAGVAYAARSGLEAAEASAELGFAVGGGEVAGALRSSGIVEADVAGGLYDGASVETWLVDWTNPETRLLLDISTVGEARRSGGAFVAELRGLMHSLDMDRGRTYRATCGAASNVTVRVVSATAAFVPASNWLLIGAVNCGDGSIRLGNGLVLRSGGT